MSNMAPPADQSKSGINPAVGCGAFYYPPPPFGGDSDHRHEERIISVSGSDSTRKMTIEEKFRELGSDELRNQIKT